VVSVCALAPEFHRATPLRGCVGPPGPGDFENDPNVTDKKFPDNPTRSYRTSAPMVVIEEITEWTRLTPEVLQTWRIRISALRDSDAEIIN